MAVRRALCVAVLVLLGTGTAQAIDKTKLRAAARPPGFGWKFGIGWKDGGFHIIGMEPDREQAIAALRKTLTGDGADAPRYVRLGDYDRQVEKKEEARQCFEKAVALYRQRLEEKPDQPRLLAEHGSALCGLEKYDEAEALIRRAVALAAEDWKCRVALGKFLSCKASRVASTKDAPTTPPKLDLLKLSLKDFLPGAEKLDQAEKWLQESRDCLDRAVALAPAEPEVYRARFLGRLNGAFTNVWITTARGRIPDPIQQNPLILMCQPEARADLYQLARHAPDDYLALGFMAQTELQAHVYQNPGTVLDGKTLLANGISAECRLRLGEAKEKLERFSKGTDPATAAKCGLILGWLQALCGETDAAIATLRRVTALDPSLTDAWSILIGALNGQERSDEAVAVCTERLKTEDTASARFALAWTYSRSPKHHDQAEGQLRLALERDAKDFHALVGMAAMLLQRATEAATLADAGKLLDQAQALVGKDEGRGKDWSLNQGIYLALSGNVTQARFCLLNVLVLEPRHPYAGQALKALDD